MLSKKLTSRIEKFLTPLGVWPSSENRAMTSFNIFVFSTFSVLVMVKIFLNPEGESIEIAFALSNACLLAVVHLFVVLLKGKRFQEFLDFVKQEEFLMISKGREILVKNEKEF